MPVFGMIEPSSAVRMAQDVSVYGIAHVMYSLISLDITCIEVAMYSSSDSPFGFSYAEQVG